MVPGCEVEIIDPVDEATPSPDAEALSAYSAVFLSGSPIHVYCETPETLRQLAFMRAVFASGTPSRGSCAGLQVAVAAAGGSVRKIAFRREAGIARGITASEAGKAHPLLAGRPSCWDAFTIHGDEVDALPADATLLASNSATRVQAVEIRSDRGTFWGVQYHPELAPGEIAVALRRSADDLVSAGLATSSEHVETQAFAFDAVHHDPASRWARWQLGIDDQAAVETTRRTELRNFLVHLARVPVQSSCT
jgi:GMP synthase (glutamine-hydrolysing)